MTYTLFLDDERDPVDRVSVVVRSYREACEYVIQNGTPTHVDFDHDLGDGPTGYDFAKWLVDRSLDGKPFPDSYAIHSQNPVGERSIRGLMDGFYAHISG